ncbi:MAG: M1 family aminopeptidase [Bacteroidales bacterium]
MVKLFTFLIFIAILFSGCIQNNNKKPKKRIYPHYEIHLSIDPQAQEIEIDGSLELNLSHVNDDTLTFYLDRGMDVTSFKLNRKDIAIIDTSQSDNRFMPLARKIFIDISALSQEDKISTIAFSYHGKVGELPEIYANRIGAQWTEMGLYYPWFPFSINQMSSFTYNLFVEAPDQYEIFGLGSLEKKNGYTEISNNLPTSDIVVCLSKDVKVNSSEIGENKLKIFYHSFDYTMVQDVAESITMMMGQYKDWFGNKNNDICLIESRRETGGGYARTGGVVLSGLDSGKFYKDIIRYENYFAHEFAHLWWHKANVNTWEDWINESFAEYSALMIIRKKHGQEVFDNIIGRKAEAIEETPPIWGFDRMGDDNGLAHQVLYNKGPVLLYELEENIGYKKFVEFCRNLITNNINSTSELLKLLESTNGKDVSESFEKKLKTS